VDIHFWQPDFDRETVGVERSNFPECRIGQFILARKNSLMREVSLDNPVTYFLRFARERME
jgi:hypothetical protein